MKRHIPKYRKHATKNLGFVEWNRKRYYFSGPYDSADSREQYRLFLFQNVGREPEPQENDEAFTVTKLTLAYLKFAERFYGPGARGEFANCKHALRPFGFRFANVKAELFGPKLLKAWLAEQAKKGQSRNYINSQLAKVKRAFKWAASEELIPVKIYQAVCTVDGLRAGKSDAKETERRQPVPWSEVEAVLPELSPIVADMVRVQWLTSARSQSLCMAKAEQFDTNCDLWLWRPRHKTESRGRVLILPIGPKCQAILKPYLAKVANGGYLFDPRKQRKNRIYGKRYKTSSYYRAIQRGIERVNERRAAEGKPLLEAWFPHIMRHSKGQEVREVYGIEGAQAHLGHDTMDATEIYSRRRLELAKQIARDIG